MTVDLTRLVKPLEWVYLGERYPHKWEDASGVYRVYDFGKNWSQDRYSLTSLYGMIGRLGQFPDLAAAQAAANADNVTRSLTNIDTALIAELVEAADSLLTSCRHFYHGSAFEEEFECEIAALAKMNGGA